MAKRRHSEDGPEEKTDAQVSAESVKDSVRLARIEAMIEGIYHRLMDAIPPMCASHRAQPMGRKADGQWTCWLCQNQVDGTKVIGGTP